MKFKIGQLVELIEKDGMSAAIGATARIESIDNMYIYLNWKTRSNNQMNGAYAPNPGRFKLVQQKGQQLLFSFMEG